MGHSVRAWIAISCFVVSTFLAVASGSPAKPNVRLQTSPKPPAIVIGFVGGFIRHDNSVHGAVQLAARLRKEYPSGVYVNVYENRRGDVAREEILHLLDTNHDGKLSDTEKQDARIIIYGHSWGGSETVTLAKSLHADKIPVLLTIQVDSVAKPGENDSVIPPNVAQAVNFYQPNGLIHGCSHIRAADPSRTQILGNFRFDYNAHPVHCMGYPWYATAFEFSHIEIECDPNVLNKVESLICSELPAKTNSNASVP